MEIFTYEGFFALDGALGTVDEFDPDVHRADSFLFFPEPPTPSILHAAATALDGGSPPATINPARSS